MCSVGWDYVIVASQAEILTTVLEQLTQVSWKIEVWLMRISTFWRSHFKLMKYLIASRVLHLLWNPWFISHTCFKRLAYAFEVQVNNNHVILSSGPPRAVDPSLMVHGPSFLSHFVGCSCSSKLISLVSRWATSFTHQLTSSEQREKKA